MSKTFKLADTPSGLLNQARVCEICERNDEMLACMKKLCSMTEADSAIRGMLSVAYKNLINARRSPWRALSVSDDPASAKLRVRLEAEIDDVCRDAFALLDEKLLPSSKDAEAKVFFLKMKGDYMRYLQEVKPSDAVLQAAGAAYDQAIELSSALPWTSPLRLGLVLNFSVFKYETLGKQKEGYDLASSILTEGTKRLANDEPIDEEAEGILMLLHENHATWKDQLGLSKKEPAQEEMQMEDC